MRKMLLGIFFLFVLFSMVSLTLAQKLDKPLTNADIVTMVKAGLPESTIILAIQQGIANFDVSPAALIELKNHGATSKIMDAALEAQGRNQNKSPNSGTVPVKVPGPKIEYKLFTFEVLQCTLFGKRLTCGLLVTNNDQDKELQIYYVRHNNSSRVIDAAGNEYKAAKALFGSDENDPTALLVTGIPMKLTFIFDDIPSNTTNINLLEIFGGFEKKDYNEVPSVQFRNVPVTILTPIASGNNLRVFEKEFSFELRSCQKMGKIITCVIAVKNNGPKESELILNVNCGGGVRSRIIDDTGTEYFSTEGSVGDEIITGGGFGSRCYATGKLAAGVTTTMTVKFDNTSGANSIKLLRLSSGYSYGETGFNVDFRDVSITVGK